jgi:hypothetical protein
MNTPLLPGDILIDILEFLPGYKDLLDLTWLDHIINFENHLADLRRVSSRILVDLSSVVQGPRANQSLHHLAQQHDLPMTTDPLLHTCVARKSWLFLDATASKMF